VVVETAWPPYQLGTGYDEIVGPDGAPRAVAHALWQHLACLSVPRLWPSANERPTGRYAPSG
jgi:hypothetical protein